MPVKDARAKPLSRTQLGLENQGFIFGLFNDDSKFTVKDVYEAGRIIKQSKGERPLNERTVRRSIDALVKEGFLIESGRLGNSVLYARRSTITTNETAQLIPYADSLLTVESFLKLFADLEVDPFKLKVNVLSADATRELRKSFLFAVMSAGEAGHNDRLQVVVKNLHGILREIEHAQKIVSNLLNSAIWYDQYRDPIGYGVRRVQEKNPELFKLAVEAMKGG